MDFLDTNTWSTGQTLAILLIWGGICLLAALWLAPTVPYTSHSFNQQDLRDDRTLRRLTYTEAALLRVRQSRKPDSDLRGDWQLIAIDGTPFEFESMLVTSVWADAGEKYYHLRLKSSPNRWEIEKVVGQLKNKIEYA